MTMASHDIIDVEPRPLDIADLFDALDAFARGTGLDGKQVRAEIERLTPSYRDATIFALLFSRPTNVRAVVASGVLSELLAEALTKASQRRLDSSYGLPSRKLVDAPTIPVALLESATELHNASTGYFHRLIVQAISAEAASDDDIAGALGIPGASEDREERILRARERIATETAGLARKLSRSLKLDRINDAIRIHEGGDALSDVAHEARIANERDAIVSGAYAEVDGMLAWDAALVALLRELGETKQAKRIEKGSRARWAARDALGWVKGGDPSPGALWRLWVDPTDLGGIAGVPFLVALTRAAWERIIRPELERERKKRPALVIQVHEDVTRIHSRAHALVAVNGQHHLRFDDGDPVVLMPATMNEGIIASIQRGASKLGSLAGIKALHWEVITGHEQAIRGDADPRVLRIEGGWSTFTHDVLGIRKKDAVEDVRDIVRTQAATWLTLPDGSTGNLLALRESDAKGQRRAELEITLGTMLLPHYESELDKKLSGRASNEARRLVPIVALPPFVGRANEHGAQATLSMLVVRELRAKATELVTHGGVAIDLDRWARLGLEAGLPNPARLVPAIIDRWTRDGDDGPAFLRITSPGRYTLGDAHTRERAFLEYAGKRSVDGAEGGRKAVAARDAARLGKGKRPRGRGGAK